MSFFKTKSNMIKLKMIQTPVFPSHIQCKPYSPYDFQWSQTQNVGNCEFIPSTSPHPIGTIHPVISRAQPGTLNLAPRVPEHAKHFITAPSTRSEGSVGAQSFLFWAGWLLLGELGTPVAPQRAGPAEPPAWLSHTTHCHRMLRVPA